MASNRFQYSGSSDRTYGDIPAGAQFNISGSGDVTIKGKCGAGAIFNKSGSGELFIKGVVEEGVIFKVAGSGDLKFSERPPQSVIDNISIAGSVDVFMPGGFKRTKKATSSLSSHGNFYGVASAIGDGASVSIGPGAMVSSSFSSGSGTHFGAGSAIGNGASVRIGAGAIVGNNVVNNYGMDVFEDASDNDNDSDDDTNHAAMVSTPVANSESARAGVFSFISNVFSSVGNSLAPAPTPPPTPSTPAVRPTAPVEESKLTPEQVFKRDCSKHTRDYLNGFENKPKTNRQIVAELNLTPAEWKLFEKCLDPIMFEIMNRPVFLHDMVYDLDTVLGLRGVDKGQEFDARDVTAHRETNNLFEQMVKQVESDRLKTQAEIRVAQERVRLAEEDVKIAKEEVEKAGKKVAELEESSKKLEKAKKASVSHLGTFGAGASSSSSSRVSPPGGPSLDNVMGSPPGGLGFYK